MKKSEKTEEQKMRDKKAYHNTELLLKKYRDVIWSMEVSAIQAHISFEIEMGCKLEEFLDMSYAAGADLSGTDIQEQMRTLERNKKMLKIIETAVSLLKKEHNNGNLYYNIIYYTYMSKKNYGKVEDIIEKIANVTGEYMAWKTYFVRRRKAIETLSTILWGFTSKECLSILEEFV